MKGETLPLLFSCLNHFHVFNYSSKFLFFNSWKIKTTVQFRRAAQPEQLSISSYLSFFSPSPGPVSLNPSFSLFKSLFSDLGPKPFCSTNSLIFLDGRLRVG